MKKTKEEIFRAVQEDLKSNHYLIPEDYMLEAMDEYKDQELEELQAKYDKLKEAFEDVIYKEFGNSTESERIYKEAGLTD